MVIFHSYVSLPAGIGKYDEKKPWKKYHVEAIGLVIDTSLEKNTC